MKILPGRMLLDARDDARELHWEPGEPWLPLRMKILPGRTALKTLDTMALCTARCLPPFLELLVEL